MSDQDAWPVFSETEQWIRENECKIKNGVISKMKKGHAVDPKHARAFASYLIHLSRKQPHSLTCKTFKEFLRDAGSAASFEMSPAKIADRIMEKDDDAFIGGFFGVLDTFLCERMVEFSVQGRLSQKQVTEAVRWLYLWVAEESAPDRTFSSLDTKINYGEKVTGLSPRKLTELTRMWLDFDEWTVVLARGKWAATGMTIVLPMREDSFRAVRSGELGLGDILPTDLCRPSRYLLIVAIAQRLPELGGDEGNTTKNLLRALITQVGILSHCDGEEAKKPLHLLATAGTPRNRQRIEGMGYRATETKLSDLRHDLFERVYKWPMPPKDLIVLGIATTIGRYADKYLLPPNRSYQISSHEEHDG